MGTLVEPDPSLLTPKTEAPPSNPATSQASAAMPDIDAMPVRVGVGIVGGIIVLGLILGARSLNRRPQH